MTYNLDNLGPFTQPTTVSNMFFAGVQEDWSPALNTFLRYRVTTNSWPIVGVTERHQLSLDAAINSNQPEHVGQVEMGGTWSVADDLMINGMFWIENSYNHSQYVNFSETAYPYTLSAWYTPNACWSFVAGYANLTNWITQDITLGRENGPAPELVAWTVPWNFTGKSDVINLAASYAASEKLRLMSQLEYVRAENYFQHRSLRPRPLALLGPAGLQRGRERYLSCHGRVRLSDPTADRRVRSLQFLRLHR